MALAISTLLRGNVSQNDQAWFPFPLRIVAGLETSRGFAVSRRSGPVFPGQPGIAAHIAVVGGCLKNGGNRAIESERQVAVNRIWNNGHDCCNIDLIDIRRKSPPF